MTKKELISALEPFDEDAFVFCMDEFGTLGNIKEVKDEYGIIAIVFGVGSPFSGE